MLPITRTLKRRLLRTKPSSEPSSVWIGEKIIMLPYGGNYPPGFKSSSFHGCSYFPRFISRFNGVVLSMVGDIPDDSVAPMVMMFPSKARRL
jgi:hypothetical protein